MPARTASDSSSPRRRRAKASIATLVALSALAGAQALAPASAGAMTDPGQTGGCRIVVNLDDQTIEGRTSDGGVCKFTEDQLFAAAEQGALGDLAKVFGKVPIDKSLITGILGLPDRRAPASRPDREWQHLGGPQGVPRPGSKQVEVTAEKKKLSPEGECLRLRRLGQVARSDEEWKEVERTLWVKSRASERRAAELRGAWNYGLEKLREHPKDKDIIKRVDDLRKEFEAEERSARGYFQAIMAGLNARDDWKTKNCEKLVGLARKDR